MAQIKDTTTPNWATHEVVFNGNRVWIAQDVYQYWEAPEEVTLDEEPNYYGDWDISDWKDWASDQDFPVTFIPINVHLENE